MLPSLLDVGHWITSRALIKKAPSTPLLSSFAHTHTHYSSTALMFLAGSAPNHKLHVYYVVKKLCYRLLHWLDWILVLYPMERIIS